MKKQNIIFIVVFFVVFVCGCAFATERYNIDEGIGYLQKIDNNENPELNSMYMQKALYNFYVASKKTPPSSEALIGLGRVYMFMDKYDDAKNALFEAYSIDKYNADANFYFAEFFYKYEDYEAALKYYKNAYSLGFKDSSKAMDMIKKCYNKLGDSEEILKIQQGN